MTVQQLIDELNKVKDKSKVVLAYDRFTDETTIVKDAQENKYGITLTWASEEWLDG